MRHIQLTSVQADMLARIRHQSQKPQVRDRAFSLLLSAQGQSIAELSTIFDKHPNTIRNWFTSYESDGLVGLYDTPGRGSKSKLKPHHKSAVLSWVAERPQDLDYTVHKIEHHLNLRVSRWTVQRYLEHHGYTLRRVRRGLPKQEEPDILEKKQKNSNS